MSRIFATISGGVSTDVIIGRPFRLAVQPTTASSGARGWCCLAMCQLRQSIAQTSARPCATATIEARCAPVSMCWENMSRLSPIASRSRVGAMIPDMESRLL